VRALETWPYDGIPDNPPAWLFRVAHNSAISVVRRRQLLGSKTEALVAEISRAAMRPSASRRSRSNSGMTSYA